MLIYTDAFDDPNLSGLHPVPKTPS
jgi:hypothetical protein